VCARRPLTAFEDIAVSSDNANASYLVGESATISCHLPRPASAVLVVVANVNSVTTKVCPSAPLHSPLCACDLHPLRLQLLRRLQPPSICSPWLV
jgi:hypothetical protein